MQSKDERPSTNPAGDLVSCRLCNRAATFTKDAICRACRPKDERKTTTDEVKR